MRNDRSLRGWTSKTKSPKSNYYWPLEQRGYWRSGCTVSHWSPWSPELAYPSPGWPPVAWQPALPGGPASCWRGRFPPATAVGRWRSGGGTRTGRRRRSSERRSQTFYPAWTPGRNLWNNNNNIFIYIALHQKKNTHTAVVSLQLHQSLAHGQDRTSQLLEPLLHLTNSRDDVFDSLWQFLNCST